MMDNNYTYSKEVLSFAAAHRIPLVYASTAAVYGLSERFAPTSGARAAAERVWVLEAGVR